MTNIFSFLRQEKNHHYFTIIFLKSFFKILLCSDQNFKTFLCDILCNPNQRDFVLVTKEEPYIPATTTNPIDAELRFEIFNQKLESNKT